MRRLGWLGVLGSVVLACDAEPPSPAPAPTAAAAVPTVAAHDVEPAPTRDARSAALVAAQAVIEESCGSCHRSDLETAVPEALAVFDLWDPQWLAGLDDVAFASVMTRLETQGVAAPDLASVRAAIAEVQAQRADPDCTQS